MEVLQSQHPVICWDHATACIPTVTSQFSSNPAGSPAPLTILKSEGHCVPTLLILREETSCPCCSALSRKQTSLLAKHAGRCSVWIELNSFWQMSNQTQISEPSSGERALIALHGGPRSSLQGPFHGACTEKMSSSLSSGDRLGSVPLI